MEKAELIERLKGYEWNDVEFKGAQRGVPDSAYETVSAFSNTEGGWLVFGVRDGAGGYEIVGVLEVDKVQNDFLSVLRSGQKLNRVIAVDERLIEDDGKALLVFHIPEARRQDKPVYLDRDIRRSFIRRGAGDERCTQTEIERLLRDAADERHDGEVVDLDPERCFNDGSVRWYRKLFDDRNPGHDATLSHLEFLHHWGLVVEVGGRPAPTRAAILLFGAAPAFRQVLPRPVVDWQWNRGHWSEELADERWADRLVIETNLVETWKTLADRYLQRAEKPFSIDPETLRRDDLPPDYLAFREAAINLLIHQDYADHTRKPVIRVFDDRALLWNPGDAFASADELLDPGEKEVRNPRIVAAFRRIGLSEQAGTGIRAIFGMWRRLGLVPPIIDNDRTRKAFQLTLLKEEILPEEQLRFQAELGVHLDGAEARAFAFACRHGRLRPRDVRAVTGLSGAGALAVLDRLAIQTLISPLEGAETPVFVLAEHLVERLGRTDRADDLVGAGASGLATDQAVREPGRLVTDQAGLEPGRLVTDQAGLEPERLVTDQAGLEPGRLVTDQVRSGQEDLSIAQPIGSSGSLSTAQAGSDPADLSAAQATKPSGSLVTDQATRPSGRLVTDQASLKPGRLVTDQAPVSGELDDVGWKIVEFCEVPRSMAEIMGELGLTHRTFFRRNHLEPLLAGGVLRMTHPDQPNHPDQAYVLTEAGAALKARRVKEDAGTGNGDRTNGA